jgi:acyl carrier protein phosphodiesterase
MNFLAHAYLSFSNPQILVGNMVSDFVKGKAQFLFNGKIQAGIRLHRMIDEFTDNHPATAKAKEIFRPAYRLYSGAIVDVLYDHYLASDPKEFDDASLRAFTAATYRQLERQTSDLPPRFLQVFTYMRTEDWLYQYRHPEGMRRSLGGLVRRAAYLSESTTAYNLFREQYVPLRECYEAFFPDVKQFAKQTLETLIA